MTCRAKIYTRARLKPVSPEIYIQVITYYDAGGPFTVEQFLAISQNAKTAPNDLDNNLNLYFFFQLETALKSHFGDTALVLQKYRKGI